MKETIPVPKSVDADLPYAEDAVTVKWLVGFTEKLKDKKWRDSFTAFDHRVLCEKKCPGVGSANFRDATQCGQEKLVRSE